MAVDVIENTGRGRKVIFSIETFRKMGAVIYLYAPQISRKLRKMVIWKKIASYPEVYEKGLFRNIIFELKLFFKYFSKLFIDIIKNKFNIVQIHGVTRAAPQILVALAGKIAGSKIIYYYHDLLPENFVIARSNGLSSLAYRFALLFEKIMVSLSDIVIAVSDIQAAIVRKRTGKKKVFVVYPPVDVNEFNICKMLSRKEILKKYGITVDKPIVLYLGGLEPKLRGLEILLDAIKEVVYNKKKDVLLLIVGDGPLRQYIQECINKYALQGHIKLLGKLPHDEAIKILCIADISVIPNPKSLAMETLMPTKLIESMAAGKIIISGNFAQPRLILKGNALFFEPSNYHDFANKIVYALDNMESLDDIKLKVKKLARKISKDILQQRLIEIYRKILEA